MLFTQHKRTGLSFVCEVEGRRRITVRHDGTDCGTGLAGTAGGRAAAQLGIPADAVYNWLRLGQVPARRGPSGRWCIPWDPASQEIYRKKVAGSVRLRPHRSGI